MNVQAFMHKPCLRSMAPTRSRRDGEHFEIAGEDHIGFGERFGEPAHPHQGSGDRDEPPRQLSVLGLPEVDRRDAFDYRGPASPGAESRSE